MDKLVNSSPSLRTTSGEIPGYRGPRCWGCLALLILALGCRSPSDPSAGKDDPNALRVVCLTPSSTEVVAAIAGVEAIVGVDEFSDYPPEVSSLPRVGTFINPSVEKIIALRPDVAVLDAVQANAAEALSAAGITVVTLRMERVDDVPKGMRAIGKALNLPAEAEAAAADFERRLAEVKQRVGAARGAGPPPQVLFVVDRELGALRSIVATGPGSYIDDLIAIAGGRNALADSPLQFTRISVEQVLQKKPEVIFDAVHTANVQRAAEDWNILTTVPAVANERIYVLGDTKFTHPGPRLPEHAEHIATLLWGK